MLFLARDHSRGFIVNTECPSEEDGGCWVCLCLLRSCFAVYFRGTQWDPLRALSSQWQAGRKWLQIIWLLVFSWWKTCLHLWCVLCSNHLKKVGGIQASHVAELQLSISSAVIVTPPLLEMWRYPAQWLREGLHVILQRCHKPGTTPTPKALPFWRQASTHTHSAVSISNSGLPILPVSHRNALMTQSASPTRCVERIEVICCSCLSPLPHQGNTVSPSQAWRAQLEAAFKF